MTRQQRGVREIAIPLSEKETRERSSSALEIAGNITDLRAQRDKMLHGFNMQIENSQARLDELNSDLKEKLKLERVHCDLLIDEANNNVQLWYDGNCVFTGTIAEWRQDEKNRFKTTGTQAEADKNQGALFGE